MVVKLSNSGDDFNSESISYDQIYQNYKQLVITLCLVWYRKWSFKNTKSVANIQYSFIKLRIGMYVNR